MRPPDLPGGNAWSMPAFCLAILIRFNEAAGFTRRKRRPCAGCGRAGPGFNEAAGFTRRKQEWRAKRL